MLKEQGKLKEEHKEPELGPLFYYIEVYMELSTCRLDGSAPIPFTSIVEFARIYELEEFFKFHYFVRILDNIYLEHCEKEARKADGRANANTSNKNSKLR